MLFSRVCAQPHRYTFRIEPIRELLFRYVGNNGKGWADPFAGKSTLAEFRNDLNPENKQKFQLEALEFLKQFTAFSLEGVIFDPPYSISQVAISYKNIGVEFWADENPTGSFPKARDQISRVVKVGGYCISFGWNTVGMGSARGFKIIEILIVSHGGNHNDTLVTVEEFTRNMKSRSLPKPEGVKYKSLFD